MDNYVLSVFLNYPATAGDDDHGRRDDIVGVEVTGDVEITVVGVAVAKKIGCSRLPGGGVEALGEG